MRKHTILLYSLISFLIFISFSSAGTCITTSATRYYSAIKDSYVDSALPTSNYGGQNRLIFGHYYYSDPAEAYLSFATSDPPSNWTKAEIEIHMYYITNATNLTICSTTASWDELTITWLNKPAHGQEITQLTVATEQVYSIDVTNFISGDFISICINATTVPAGYVEASSREGGFGSITPKLKWTFTPPELKIPGFNTLIFLGLMLGIGICLILKFNKK